MVASSSLVTPTMKRRRRTKRIGFGFTNLVLGLAVVIGTLVVTQTKALQYLRCKLTSGNTKSEQMVGLMDNSYSKVPNATSKTVNGNDTQWTITLSKAVTGKKSQGMMLEKTGYVSYFNYDRNNPDWVAWELTASEAKGRLDRKGYLFIPDEKLPKENRVAHYDYKKSRYDRGHMCPAGDMKWSAAAMHDCFYMSNVCPQDHELNQGSWEHLESACRRWASKMGSIYIVCGPIYNSKTPEYIGIDHRVAVPDAFFKVVVSLKKGNEKGIAFYYENTDRNQSLTTAVRSIDQIEKMTKFDFFSELPNNVENRIEAETKLW